ncbi:hypothetical protein BD311DRAFT_775638 [Dichomitus squalens]|uniref:Uncharacterized protein n=1 Tax=Dichomitus squalens TaxID=114155 RepID=A0A4Q9MVW7_9APHY|nr:hypothetical protein BD311DRAFT_775638 [Dichomitus squalens]
MVDWTSQQELTRDGAANINVVFASFGLYIWEVFQTSDFEWSILQGKRKLTISILPLPSLTSFCAKGMRYLPFFIARYILVLSIASLMASFTVKHAINCHSLYIFICVAGNLSIICASVVLMLRTIAVWERKLPIVVALGTLCLAHTALLVRGMLTVSARYDAVQQMCVATALSHTNRVFLSVTFWSTLGFNLVITVLHVAGLMKSDEGSSVWELLFREGVVYYLIAFTFNALPAIFSIVNLNSECDLQNVISATRTVTRLPDMDDDDIYVHSATQLASPRVPNAAYRFTQNKTVRYPARPEVHVTTDQIVMEDFAASPTSAMTDKPQSLTGDDKSSFNAV